MNSLVKSLNYISHQPLQPPNITEYGATYDLEQNFLGEILGGFLM